VASGFRDQSIDDKRVIVCDVGSNPLILDRELKIDVARPFRRWTATPTNSELWTYVNDVRTFAIGNSSQEKLQRLQCLWEKSPAPQKILGETA
jgi:hypothetical protein